MLREERHKRIAEYVDAHSFVSLDELKSVTEASQSTLRRDLMQLNEEGRILLVRGGAASIKNNDSRESIYRVKETISMEGKQRIGLRAAALVGHGESVFLAAGTTCRTMTAHLTAVEELKLVTNDIQIAMDAADAQNISVIVTGGQLRRHYYSLRGFGAENSMSSMRVQWGFISCDAVDVDGVYIYNEDEVNLLHCVIQSSGSVVLLADHSKLNSSSFALVCDLSCVDILITDTQPDEILARRLAEEGVRVIIA